MARNRQVDLILVRVHMDDLRQDKVVPRPGVTAASEFFGVDESKPVVSVVLLDEQHPFVGERPRLHSARIPYSRPDDGKASLDLVHWHFPKLS